jgi:hypothetical protein
MDRLGHAHHAHGQDAKANQRDFPPLASAQPSLTRTGACRFLPFTFGIAATVYLVHCMDSQEKKPQNLFAVQMFCAAVA